jgi:hypothetical protein
MKIYKSCYRNHWISPYTVLDYLFFWTDWSKCSRNSTVQTAIDELDGKYKYIEHPEWVDRWADRLSPISQTLQWFLDKVHPQIKYVKIDRWDTWSMDHTLADIILPMLRQLKETKHGAPFTDDEDVPEYLRSYMAQPKEYEWDTDSLHFMRWDWILDEMIWAFEQKVKDDADSEFFDHSECDDEKFPWNKDGQYVSKVKYDQEGHEAWQKRKSNGFRLFGRYYENLWD